MMIGDVLVQWVYKNGSPELRRRDSVAEARAAKHWIYVDQHGSQRVYIFQTEQDARILWKDYQGLLLLTPSGTDFYPADMSLQIDKRKVAHRRIKGSEV